MRGAICAQVPDPSKMVISVLEVVESPDPEVSLGVWNVVARWAVELDRFPAAVLAPVARGIVKVWDGCEERQLRTLHLTAGNAQFVELASFRDAIVEAMLETSSKPVRDATKLAGARHFPRQYWEPALPRIQAAARNADAVLIANGSFVVAGHVRELLAQLQTLRTASLLSPEELAAFVASAAKAKDLRPATALFVRAWVSAQAARGRGGNQDAIKAARLLLDPYPWVLYTFSSSAIRLSGRGAHTSELLSADESAFVRARHAIKNFTLDASSDDDIRALERAVRDAAVSCTLSGGRRDLALPAGFLASIAVERAAHPGRANTLDGLFLALIELFVASGRATDLTTTYLYAREAMYLSGVSGRDEEQSSVYCAGLAALPQPEQADLLLTLTQAYNDDLDTYVATRSPGLAVRVAARLDALTGCIVALKDGALAYAAMARLLATASLVYTAPRGPAPVLTLALAATAASLVRTHHSLFDHTLVQSLLALSAGLLAVAGDDAASAAEPPLSRAWTVAALNDILAALGPLVRQRRKVLRPVLGTLGGVLGRFLPLLRVDGAGDRPGWVCSRGLDGPATTQLATNLARVLDAVTAKGVAREFGEKQKGATKGKTAPLSLAEGFAPHAHALLAAYARTLLGAEKVVCSPLDRPGAVQRSGHIAPETQRALEPGIFALCNAAALAPAARDAALKFHLAAPTKTVLKRLWSTWEAQRYKGQ